MARKSFLLILCAALLLSASCKKSPDKTAAGDKHGKKAAQARKSAPAQKPAPAGLNKSLKEILASVPCKLDDKPGLFALFPDNPVSGQWCFTLIPGDPARGIPSFDIQTNDFYVVIHDTAPRDPDTVSIMRWPDNGSGGPDLTPGAAVQVPVARDKYPDTANPGWSWIVLTPQPAADFTSGAGGFYGLMIKDGAEQTCLPLFN